MFAHTFSHILYIRFLVDLFHSKSLKIERARLIDVELALSSGQFSVTGAELSNKVMAGELKKKGRKTKENTFKTPS